jgi:predicted N-acyltransferase
VAFGRYWGCTQDIPMLHFEACYYRPLAWCIENGFNRFEGGAQCVHKLARGLLPVPTVSAHWVSHDGFRAAIRDHLANERADIFESLNELAAHSPMRRDEP